MLQSEAFEDWGLEVEGESELWEAQNLWHESRPEFCCSSEQPGQTCRGMPFNAHFSSTYHVLGDHVKDCGCEDRD